MTEQEEVAGVITNAEEVIVAAVKEAKEQDHVEERQMQLLRMQRRQLLQLPRRLNNKKQGKQKMKCKQSKPKKKRKLQLSRQRKLDLNHMCRAFIEHTRMYVC